MNNLFQQLQQKAQDPPQLKQKSFTNNNNFLLKSFLNSSNPSEFIQNMIKSNPQMQSAMQLFQNSGMTPKSFFYQYAQQNGVDPNQFLSSLMN